MRQNAPRRTFNMLIEFTSRNFLSIREEATLSLVKARGDELADTNSFHADALGQADLLRSAAIYGANAAGKSNLVKALKTMQNTVLNSASKSQAGEKLPVTPFLLDETSAMEACEFEVTFISDGVRYQYGFAATAEKVTEEWLLAYPKGLPQRWIERAFDPETQRYTWGGMGKLTGSKQTWQDATRENALFLSTAIQLNNQQLKPVFNWFADMLHVAGLGGWHEEFTIELCEKDQTRQDVVAFLKAADVDIEDIALEKEQFDPSSLPEDMPDAIKQEIEERYKDKQIVNVKTAHAIAGGRKVLLDMDAESDGTQKLFALAGPWLDTLEHGYVLIIDELHDNLHPLMVQFLIKLFNNSETNPKNAQLIFTTHDTSILSQEVFRRDQVWFCEKGKEQNTRLYPLTDFSPRKGVENLERGYLSGRYGALPYIRSIKATMGC